MSDLLTLVRDTALASSETEATMLLYSRYLEEAEQAMMDAARQGRFSTNFTFILTPDERSAFDEVKARESFAERLQAKGFKAEARWITSAILKTTVSWEY